MPCSCLHFIQSEFLEPFLLQAQLLMPRGTLQGCPWGRVVALGSMGASGFEEQLKQQGGLHLVRVSCAHPHCRANCQKSLLHLSP